LIHTTENRSDLSPVTLARTFRSGFRSLSRTLLHMRATVRLARRRPALALGFAVAASSALTAATVTGSVAHQQILLQSRVEPLAPPPAPPAPPVDQPRKIHHLLPFHGNPLRGLASWYGSVWNGRPTASGETFDETKLTAAHKT
jgi:rare lipoprotein A